MWPFTLGNNVNTHPQFRLSKAPISCTVPSLKPRNVPELVPGAYVQANVPSPKSRTWDTDLLPPWSPL